MTFSHGTADVLRRQIREAVVREPRAYAFPRGLRVAPFARLPDSVVSLFADVFVYVAACPFLLGFGAILFRDLWPLAALGTGFAYLWLTWASGQSLGMRYSNLRLVVASTGADPGLRRAAVRAALILPVIVAVFLLVDAVVPAEAALPSSALLIHGAELLVAFGVVSYLWALWDSEGRPLHDVLCGLVTIEDAPARPGTRRVARHV